MNDRLKESISALMDDEVNELELQRILSHTGHHELASTWSRYHRVRDVLNNDKNYFLEVDVCQAVSQNIEQDSQPELQRKTDITTPANGATVPSRSRLSGFLAIAASVAFASIFVIQNGAEFDLNRTSPLITDLNETQSELSLASVSTIESSHRQPKILVGFNAEHAKRFNDYLLRHSEHSALGSQSSVMPLARVASVNSIGI